MKRAAHISNMPERGKLPNELEGRAGGSLRPFAFWFCGLLRLKHSIDQLQRLLDACSAVFDETLVVTARAALQRFSDDPLINHAFSPNSCTGFGRFLRWVETRFSSDKELCRCAEISSAECPTTAVA